MAVAWRIFRISSEHPEDSNPSLLIEAELYNTITNVRIGNAYGYTIKAATLAIRDEQERLAYIEQRVGGQLIKTLSTLTYNENVEKTLTLLGSLQQLVGVEHTL